jgi:hypothetical protein
LALSLCVACGGDDKDNDDGGKAGSGGSSSTSGGSTSMGGGKAGSSASGGSGSGVDLPSDKPLGELTDSEAEQLCDDFDELTSTGVFATAPQELSCLLQGVLLAAFASPTTDAELQAACQAAYDECKTMPLESEPSTCEKPDATCTATVEEVEKCLTDSAQTLQDLVDSLPTCAELKVDSEPTETPDFADPPSCVTVREKCPGLDTPSAM